jgi:hypothetical protein
MIELVGRVKMNREERPEEPLEGEKSRSFAEKDYSFTLVHMDLSPLPLEACSCGTCDVCIGREREKVLARGMRGRTFVGWLRLTPFNGPLVDFKTYLADL